MLPTVGSGRDAEGLSERVREVALVEVPGVRGERGNRLVAITQPRGHPLELQAATVFGGRHAVGLPDDCTAVLLLPPHQSRLLIRAHTP